MLRSRGLPADKKEVADNQQVEEPDSDLLDRWTWIPAKQSIQELGHPAGTDQWHFLDVPDRPEEGRDRPGLLEPGDPLGEQPSGDHEHEGTSNPKKEPEVDPLADMVDQVAEGDCPQQAEDSADGQVKWGGAKQHGKEKQDCLQAFAQRSHEDDGGDPQSEPEANASSTCSWR